MAKENHNSKGLQRAQGIMNPTSPRLLTLKDAANWLGLTVWAMRERVWSGSIPFVKFPGGRKIYIDVKDLEAFIWKNKTTFGKQGSIGA